MSAIVLNDRGQPEPPSWVQEGLARVSPRLRLRYYGATGHSHWAIVAELPEGDARWQFVGTPEVKTREDAVDIVGWLPLGVAVDEAPGYLARQLAAYPREDIKHLAERVAAFNSQLIDRNLAAAGFDEARNQAEVQGYKLFAAEGKAIPKVWQNEARAGTAPRAGRKRHPVPKAEG